MPYALICASLTVIAGFASVKVGKFGEQLKLLTAQIGRNFFK